MDDQLYHYGLLGMKWGKRKTSNVSEQNLQKNNKPNRSRDMKIAATAAIGTALTIHGPKLIRKAIKNDKHFRRKVKYGARVCTLALAAYGTTKLIQKIDRNTNESQEQNQGGN